VNHVFFSATPRLFSPISSPQREPLFFPHSMDFSISGLPITIGFFLRTNRRKSFDTASSSWMILPARVYCGREAPTPHFFPFFFPRTIQVLPNTQPHYSSPCGEKKLLSLEWQMVLLRQASSPGHFVHGGAFDPCFPSRFWFCLCTLSHPHLRVDNGVFFFPRFLSLYGTPSSCSCNNLTTD